MNLVLIPGFMANASLWDEVAPGEFGPLTYGDVSQQATIPAMARHVAANAPDRFILIVFSMGGYVAREVARVQALVLVATSARADTPEQAHRKAAAIANLSRSRFTGLSRTAIAALLHPPRAMDASLIERIRHMGERLGREVFLRQAGVQRESDLHRLGEIHCPTLVVAAAQDPLRSLAEAQELEQGIAGSSLTLIEGSGHMVPIEAPVAFTQAVVPWLRQLQIS